MRKLCKTAFANGIEARSNHRLRPGSSYKLIEAYRCWDERLEALATIQAHLASETPIPPNYELNGWMGFEWETELRKLPRNRARDLGWRVLPAIKAICGTKNPSTDCKDIIRTADRDAEQLIIFFDELHPEISRVAKDREEQLEQVSSAVWLINSGRAWMEDAFWAAGIPQSAYRQA